MQLHWRPTLSRFLLIAPFHSIQCDNTPPQMVRTTLRRETDIVVWNTPPASHHMHGSENTRRCSLNRTTTRSAFTVGLPCSTQSIKVSPSGYGWLKKDPAVSQDKTGNALVPVNLVYQVAGQTINMFLRRKKKQPTCKYRTSNSDWPAQTSLYVHSSIAVPSEIR